MSLFSHSLLNSGWYSSRFIPHATEYILITSSQFVSLARITSMFSYVLGIILSKLDSHSVDEIAAPDSFLNFISTNHSSLFNAICDCESGIFLLIASLNCLANSLHPSSFVNLFTLKLFTIFSRSPDSIRCSSDPSSLICVRMLYIVWAVDNELALPSVDALDISVPYRSFIAVDVTDVFTAQLCSCWNRVGCVGSQNPAPWYLLKKSCIDIVDVYTFSFQSLLLPFNVIIPVAGSYAVTTIVCQYSCAFFV